jgi:hypothetical protein
MADEKRTSERKLLESEVTFHTGDDIYMSKSVDVSETGIRIVTGKPININIQIKDEDKTQSYDAQLVWAKVKDDGTMEYGLKF